MATSLKQQSINNRNRNRKRRSDYASDEAYRQACIESSRKNYRERYGVVLTTCLGNLKHLSRFGTTRPVSYGSTQQDDLTFTMQELANILGYSLPVLYRWKQKQLIPASIATALVRISIPDTVGYEISQEVYLPDEVRAMVQVLGEHQRSIRYYRERDVETRNKLFDAVLTARANAYGV